jgi:sigma-B regulation protein RsbU (phosphoserine phosphatase)
MSLPFKSLVLSKKLEAAIVVILLIVVIKFIFPTSENWVLLLVGEILVGGVCILFVLYSQDFIIQKRNNPLSLLINSGILAAVIFFLTALSSTMFDVLPKLSANITIIYTSISLLISFVLLAAIGYIFSSLRLLYFLRQKKETHKSYDAMITFFVLAFISAIIQGDDGELTFIGLTFFTVSIILIVFNSFRVSWIAFLSKKQKISLLFISILLSTLFSLNFALSYDNSFINQLLTNFSPGLHRIIQIVMIYGAIYSTVIFFTALFHLPTAEAFDKKVAEASSLKSLSKLITTVFDFNELADTITSLTNEVSNADSSWLVTKVNKEWKLSSVSNIGFVEANEITKVLDEEGILKKEEYITYKRKKVKVTIKNDVRKYDFQALAVSPLKVHNDNKGFLFAVKRNIVPFEEDEIKSIQAFADYAAVALENAKLIEESIERERLKSELNVARDIQYKIIPSDTPSCDELDIAAHFIPAFEVGGDYYDFFQLSENKLGIVIADVSGKGIGAAFIMAEIKGIFESLTKLIESPKELLIKVNQILSRTLDKKTFVTAVYGVVDKSKGTFTFSRAGHMPVYLIRNGSMKQYIPSGIGLGMSHFQTFEETIEELKLNLLENDVVALYTDGVTEAKNLDFEEFDFSRLEDSLKNSNEITTDVLKGKIINKISTFVQGNSQYDDITLVLFKWTSNNNSSGVN